MEHTDAPFGEEGPTETCIARVMREEPRWSRAKALDYIAAGQRANLICLDCGSENHTRGSDWCNYDLAEAPLSDRTVAQAHEECR